jgi:hypothetical protein
MNTSAVAKVCGALLGLGMLVSPAFTDDDHRGGSVDDQWRSYCSHEHDRQYDSYCERYRDHDGNRDQDRWSDDQWREYCRHHRDERRCDRYRDDNDRSRWSDDQWREFCRNNHDDRYNRDCEHHRDDGGRSRWDNERAVSSPCKSQAREKQDAIDFCTKELNCSPPVSCHGESGRWICTCP